MSNLKKTTVCVKGMHCPSCDILVKDKFEEVKNVHEVKADHLTQKVEITYSGKLDKHALNKTISSFGYKIVENEKDLEKESIGKRLMDAGMIAMLLFMLYFFAQEFELIPNIDTSSGLSITAAFLLGLFASTSTCMATSGALFLSTVGKLQNKEKTVRENIIPALFFNVGRIMMYGIGGFLLGYVGKYVSSNFQFGSWLSFLVSVMMIFVGLDMLRIFSLSSILPMSIGQNLFSKIEHRLIRSPQKTSFFLGVLTYWLPCGFTQTVQLYALSTANPMLSAMLMMIFAIGTTPALLAIGFASSFTKSSYYGWFTKVVGVLIVLIGLNYVSNTITIYATDLGLITKEAPQEVNIEMQDGYQVVRMDVVASGYEPNSFVIKEDTPVKWIINGKNVFGCQAYLMSSKLGIKQVIEPGENIIEFTPKEKGNISFSCSMNMYRGSFTVI